MEPKPYDLEMIRDFIRHVLLASRIAEHEAAYPGAINQGYVDELVSLMRKYDDAPQRSPANTDQFAGVVNMLETIIEQMIDFRTVVANLSDDDAKRRYFEKWMPEH